MSGFEVREKPTFEGVKDRNWPSTASISLQESGYAGLTVYARAAMKALGEVSPEWTGFNIPKDTPPDEAEKIIKKQIGDTLAETAKKLRAQVAQEHPEVKAKDVTVYHLRYYVFTLKLGETSRTCEMVCSVPLP